MDDIGIPSVSDFCNLGKSIKTLNLRSGAVMGRQIVQPDLLHSAPKMAERLPGGQEYAQKYVEEEERLLLKGHGHDDVLAFNLPGSSKDTLCEMEDFTSMGSVPHFGDVESEESLRVYDDFDFTPKKNADMKIEKKRDLIVRMVETNQALVILGATGCGKTTLVPQFILDHHAKLRKRCNIIVTQPRRIAAVSIAKRVASVRGWDVSSVVGYQIGLDNKTSPDTRLTYCTTGVLREKLVKQRHMNDYTHVIIDEVHERDIETDFLMLIVRHLLRTNSRTVKVILMSATIDPSHFAEYFSVSLSKTLCPAPVLEVEQFTSFKVDEFFLNQLQELGNIPNLEEFDMDDPGVHEKVVDISVKLIMYLDKIDFDTFVAKMKREPAPTDKWRPVVLVFLPGIHEIETFVEQLEGKDAGGKYKWTLVPLHSSLPREDHRRVFDRPAVGYRKIILSTNIAESSITVPDVGYVIDLCLTKHLLCDPVTNFTSLRYAWAAHSNCKQRAGRTGRNCEGRVYRMVPEPFFQSLPLEAAPEMMRCPLSQTVLKAKLLKMGGPLPVLGRALDPPDLSRLETTVLLLKEAGALLRTSEGKPDKYDGDITFLGSVMSQLPVDIQLSKMIMLGNIFSILDDAIIMAAWMTVRSVFKNDFYDRLGPYASKISFTGGTNSDCIAYLHLHRTFAEKLRTNYFKTSRDDEEGWCKRFFLSRKSMYEANELVDELKKRLKNLGVYESVSEGRTTWSESDLAKVRKVIMAGAFYPNYFIRGAQAGQVNEEDAVRELGGRDPFTTVYLKNMPPNEPGELYSKTIRDICKKYAGAVSSVTFDGSSKVYIQFERERNRNLPGRIAYPVYRAVKMRQLRIPIEIHLLPTQEAHKRMEKYGAVTNRYLCLEKIKGKPVNRFPVKSVQDIEFLPSYVTDPNRFWIHSGIEAELNSYQTKLNTQGNIFSLSGKPIPGSIYAAPFPQDSEILYRAQICAINKDGTDTVKVIFIDYGNMDDSMPIKKIFEFGPNIQDLKYKNSAPPLALECTLTGVGPSPFLSKTGDWSEGAVKKFSDLLSRGPLLGEIFSIVDEQVSLIVKCPGKEKSLNQILVERGFAVPIEESVRSKKDHADRMQARDYGSSSYEPSSNSNIKQSTVLEVGEIQHSTRREVDYLEPPSRQECRRSVKLRGPISPLEMKVYGCTRVSSNREVTMDLDSVNCVLLDTNPEDPHERLLVAGYVASNSMGSKLKLGHTTLMPNVKGLAALMCLIFSPVVELRLSRDKTKYVGALCGLGFNKSIGESEFPENEIEVAFDCCIDLQDMQLVNKLRFWLSKPLAAPEGDDTQEATPAEILTSQGKVKEYFLKLLKKERQSQEVEFFSPQHCWEQYPMQDKLVSDFEDSRAVFPPHFAVATKDLSS